VVAEAGARLPSLVQLEFEGRYAAMLSHEPKNYALLRYDGALVLRGVAFRSSRSEPFGQAFLKRALTRLLSGDVAGVREVYLETVHALRTRSLPTHDVASRVRLTKSPERYLASRESRRELSYEALLASGRTTWNVGERVRVYRTTKGRGAVAPEEEREDPRDYDVDHYVRVLHDSYASRMARALAPADYAAVFADAEQLSLFSTALEAIRPILTVVGRGQEADEGRGVRG
jgi:DNA polymerase elongation subunit (family B)